MFHFIIQTLANDDRRLFILTNLLLFAVGFLIAWAPSLLIRRYIFKEPVPWWAGVLVAAVTLLLGMGVGVMLTGHGRSGIHAAAAVCAYFTVTRRGKAAEV